MAGLDGLRGLAAIAVFAVHFNQVATPTFQFGPFDLERLLANGEHGVSLFFTLSGFLLSLPFWRALFDKAGGPDLATYARRRLARILPAYMVCLTLLIVVSGYWRTPGSGADIALHYSLLFNYTEFSIFSLNPAFWSLAVEVQFYVLLPLIFMLGKRLTSHPWGTIAILATASYLLHRILLSTFETQIFWPGSNWLLWLQPGGAVLHYSLPAHLPHFLLGLALGHAWMHEGVRTWLTPERADSIFWSCLILCTVLLATPWGDVISFPAGRYSLPVVPVLLALVIFTAPLAPGALTLLASRPVHQLGLISYGVYIYHHPIQQWVDHWMSSRGLDAAVHWWLFGLVSLMLTLIAAALSYRIVEKPVLNWAHR